MEDVQEFTKREVYDFKTIDAGDTLFVGVQEDGDIILSHGPIHWTDLSEEVRILSPRQAQQLGQLLIGLCGGE